LAISSVFKSVKGGGFYGSRHFDSGGLPCPDKEHL
jgi:hypothetical protein